MGRLRVEEVSWVHMLVIMVDMVGGFVIVYIQKAN